MKSNIKSLYQTPKALLLGAQNQLGSNMSKTGSKGNMHNASTDSLEGTAKGGSRKNLKDKNAFEGGLPPKGRFDKGQKLRGRNHVPPNNTFGVSREEREQILSYKYFSPPTGAYYVKYKQVDVDDKIAKIVPEGSSPERDPRFDYSKKDTLLWLPHARELEGVKIANHNQFGVCTKCLKREGSIMGGSCDHSFYHTEHQQSAQKLVTQETLGNTLESTADGQNIHIQDGGIQQQLSTIKHAKFTTPGHSSPFNSSKFLNNPTGTGILNFATMTARKPITEGFLNPHDERFVLPKNQFPEILTKHRQQVSHTLMIYLYLAPRRDPWYRRILFIWIQYLAQSSIPIANCKAAQIQARSSLQGLSEQFQKAKLGPGYDKAFLGTFQFKALIIPKILNVNLVSAFAAYLPQGQHLRLRQEKRPERVPNDRLHGPAPLPGGDPPLLPPAAGLHRPGSHAGAGERAKPADKGAAHVRAQDSEEGQQQLQRGHAWEEGVIASGGQRVRKVHWLRNIVELFSRCAGLCTGLKIAFNQLCAP